MCKTIAVVVRTQSVLTLEYEVEVTPRQNIEDDLIETIDGIINQ